VTVDKIDARPGITFVAPAGGWSMAGLDAIEANVKNTGKHTLNVHLVIDGPAADRTHRKNCKITSETIPPGEEKTLAVSIVPGPPSPIEWLRDGKQKTHPFPERSEKDGYGLSRADAISIYVYHPAREYTHEVSGFRAIPAAEDE
jgi:hypothetical protein